MIQLARHTSRRETAIGGRARVGKIARLPREVREQLNRRLLDGEKGQTLLVWLNSHKKVQGILKAEFDGRGISKQNLSEWMHGGYREWVFQQEAIEVVRRMDIDAAELNKASKTPLIDLLSRRLAAQYMVMLANGMNGKGAIDPRLLNELCGNVVALRRSDQRADRLKIDRDRLKMERDELRKLQDGELFEQAWRRREAVISYIETRARHNEELYQMAAALGKSWKSNGSEDYQDTPGDESTPPDESDPVKPSQT